MNRSGSEQEVSRPALADHAGTFGKYQLFAILGRGGMADVFLAIARGPRGFNKLVVLKRLRASLADEPELLTMFLDEARLAARLNHPNVVNTYEVGEHDGSFFIAMEYLEGQSVNRILNTANKMAVRVHPAMCARIVSDALNGIHYAHELRDYDGSHLHIVHRDASPHNVVVTYDGMVKVLDFGIAKAALSSTQTEVGVLKGKVAYMAPEQLLGDAIDRRADIFVLGIVLWELLTGRRLITGQTDTARANRLIHETIPRVSTVVDGVDPALDDIVARALEKDPARRYQTALEMREALEAHATATGRLVRQEDLGKFVTNLFQNVREEIRSQIQIHMASAGAATTTRELASLGMGTDPHRRSDASSSMPGLPRVGAGSDSGLAFGRMGAARMTSGVAATGSLATETDARVQPPPYTPTSAPRWPASTVALVASLLLGGGASIALVFAGLRFARPRAATTPEPTVPVAAASSSAANQAPRPVAVASEASAAPTPPPLSSSTTLASAAPTGALPRRVGVAPRIPVAPVRPPASTIAPSSTSPAPALENGFLTLDTYPWTRVSDGGRVLGTTPLVHVALAAGTHVLTLENPDQGVKQTYSVSIKAGESISRRLAFK